MEPWIKSWLEEKAASRLEDGKAIEIEDFGELALNVPFAVWHPLDDLHEAPRVPFDQRPRVRVFEVGGELMGYVFSVPGDVADWEEIGDASTDADRFFLVQLDQIDAAIDWFNEDLDGFEHLGGNQAVELVEKGDARVVVIQSGDGNALVRGGRSADGKLVCVIIEA